MAYGLREIRERDAVLMPRVLVSNPRVEHEIAALQNVGEQRVQGECGHKITIVCGSTPVVLCPLVSIGVCASL